MSSPLYLSAHGKLLLTAEYFVTEGAQALALPCRYGQYMYVMANNSSQIQVQSIDVHNQSWFEAHFDTTSLQCTHSTAPEFVPRFQQLLQAAQTLYAAPLPAARLSIHLEFPQNWGLGSSSTLLLLLSDWLNIDVYALAAATFGGSGYDLAAGKAQGPILYQNQPKPQSSAVTFQPPFLDQLYFVHLEQKQNTRDAMTHYRNTPTAQRQARIPQINALTQDFLQAQQLADFEALILEHESIIASTIQQPRAQTLYFSDFWGSIKSLGGWGGDFVLATSARSVEETQTYFATRGFTTCLPYRKMIFDTTL